MSHDDVPRWVNYLGVKWYGPCISEIRLHDGSVQWPRVWFHDVLKVWHYEESWRPMPTGAAVTTPTQLGATWNAAAPGVPAAAAADPGGSAAGSAVSTPRSCVSLQTAQSEGEAERSLGDRMGRSSLRRTLQFSGDGPGRRTLTAVKSLASSWSVGLNAYRIFVKRLTNPQNF